MTTLQSASARHRRPVPALRIAMLGTRGVPLAAGGAQTGAESVVEEVGRRLVADGHEITVYGRATEAQSPKQHLGMRVVTVPALRAGPLGAVSGTALSAAHLAATQRHDVAFVFDAVNAPLVPLLRSRGTAVAVHVGGPDWQHERAHSWSRRYARLAEHAAVREADALIADSRAVQAYYEDEFGVQTDCISPGATIVRNAPADLVEALGLVPGHFHLVAARPEPEHHTGLIVEGYHRSGARLPLVVAGGTGSSAAAEGIRRVAARDPRIRLLGEVHDRRLVEQLSAHAISYLHGHSAGGTDPALLRAMGAGTAVLAWDVAVNREVAGTAGFYFRSGSEVARQLEEVEQYPFRFHDIGELMQERARKRYDWNLVTEAYEALAAKLARGYSTRGMSSGRRPAGSWSTRPEVWRRVVADARAALGTGVPDRARPERTVLVAHPDARLDGAGRAALETVAALLERGWRVVLAAPQDGPLVAAARRLGAETVLVAVPAVSPRLLRPAALVRFLAGSRRARPRIDGLLHALRPAVVVVAAPAVPLWTLRARLLGVPVVAQVHEAERASRLLQEALAWPLLLADRVLVPSAHCRSGLVDVLPSLARRAAVVPPGVAAPEGASCPRPQLTGRLRLVVPGPLDAASGADVAVDALAILVGNGIDAELEVAGPPAAGSPDGSLDDRGGEPSYDDRGDEHRDEALRTRAIELGLGDRVRFADAGRTAWEAMEAADVVLVPATAPQAFGDAAVQAVLAARPVVVSEIGGLAEAVEGFSSAVGVAPDDAMALATAVQRIALNWPAFRRSALALAPLAARRFDPSVHRARVAGEVAAAARVHVGSRAERAPRQLVG